MRRNKVEVTAERPTVVSEYVYFGTGEDGGSLFRITTAGFKKTFGFTPRPGRKIKITMEIQEDDRGKP